MYAPEQFIEGKFCRLEQIIVIGVLIKIKSSLNSSSDEGLSLYSSSTARPARIRLYPPPILNHRLAPYALLPLRRLRKHYMRLGGLCSGDSGSSPGIVFERPPFVFFAAAGPSSKSVSVARLSACTDFAGRVRVVRPALGRVRVYEQGARAR
ncbi:hypothetical protein FIBSPDRAFT_968145 [Athelia psychrophila]|uniref:Uncharacterized protein n=1 Tax=Athelia psychrophila TaxID=1759441 RepID=A0A167UYW4_9AGAM|nr:hypothetical protein FIBSPDRAFT_968145 [Fibularhizoctonia sp. CBS 109695]